MRNFSLLVRLEKKNWKTVPLQRLLVFSEEKQPKLSARQMTDEIVTKRRQRECINDMLNRFSEQRANYRTRGVVFLRRYDEITDKLETC